MHGASRLRGNCFHVQQHRGINLEGVAPPRTVPGGAKGHASVQIKSTALGEIK